MPSSRVLISNIQIDSKNNIKNKFQTPLPNQSQNIKEIISNQISLKNVTSKQARPQSQQHYKQKQISSKDKFEVKVNQSFHQIEIDPIEQYQSRNDLIDHTLTQNQGRTYQIIQQNRFQPFEVDQNNQINSNTAGVIGMDGIIRINNNKTISENGDAFKQMQINNITNRKINSVKQQIQKQQLAYISAASSIQKLNQQNIIELQKKSMQLSNKSIVIGIQDSNQINLFQNQDNYQYLDIYGKNDIQYANSRLDIGTEPQSSISYQQPLEATKTVNNLKEQEESKIQSQKGEISIENREKTKLYSKNQRSFTATSKSIKDKMNDPNFLIELGLPSNSDFANDNQKVDIFPNNVGAQFQNETIQDSVKSVNALEVQNINNKYYQNLNQNQQNQAQQKYDQNVENYQRIILNPLQTNFQALQQQILSDVQVNGVSINQKLSLKKDSLNQMKSEQKIDKNNEQNLKFKKNRKLVQKGGLKEQKKERYGSAMMVQHQTSYLQQAQSLARYRNLFDPMLQKNNQKLQFDQLYLVQGNSFKLISKQKGQTNQSVDQNDSKMIGTTMPNEQSTAQNITNNIQQQNNHGTENTFQNIDTVNAADLETDNVTRVHESRYSAFSRIGSNLHNYQQDQKIPNHYYFNHLQSSRDLNLYPNNLINSSSQRNVKNNIQQENYQQIDNNQFQYLIDNAVQNEFKNDKFNQTVNAHFSSAFKHKEITENNSISGAKTYYPLDQFLPIKGVQIMLNQNNYSGKTTPVIKMGEDRVSASHKSSTRKILKDSQQISSQQTPKLQDTIPIKTFNQQSQLTNYDFNVNQYHLQQNVEIMKNVNLSKEQRKKKNNSHLRTLLSLQNVQQSGKQPSLKNAIWGNDRSEQQSPFLKLQANAYGISETNYINAGQQNKRTNSTFSKSKQDIISNIQLTTNYDNKTDQSNLNMNEDKQVFEDMESEQESEANKKRKVKKHDQNALNKKWMTKFFRKRDQIQSASANQIIKRKKNSGVLNNLLQSNIKDKICEQKTQNYNQTQTSFKKNKNNQQNNMISFIENQQNDFNQNEDQQNLIAENKIISNIVTKEIILSAQKEIVEQKKESQEAAIKRDLLSPYNIKSQQATKNYKFIQKINDQQEILKNEEIQNQMEIKIEEQKEIESIVNILKKQNDLKGGKKEKNKNADQKIKPSFTDTKQQQITRKLYQQERENELLKQINLYQNIQQYNIKSQQHIKQYDQNTLKYYQQNIETQNNSSQNINDVNKSSNFIKLTPQKQNKTSFANDSSDNIKGSTDLSFSKSQILQKSKKSIPQEKRLTIYQKQEIEFQKVYKQKIEQLRAMPDGLFEQRKSFDFTKSIEKQTETSKINDQTQNELSNNFLGHQTPPGEYDAKQFRLKDYNLYQERNIHQNILSTRMITLCKYLKQSIHSRQLLHKDQIFEIDPIRQKIRVMPQNRVPLQQGISPEYYFIQATKHCLRNNLPLAIQSLHKGFSINPNNLYCRITHGVLMFKLGLFTQAKHDFQTVVSLYPKEPFCHYNYALTLLQMGELSEALAAIDVITKKKSDIQKADFELLQDAHTLQAICLWRISCPLEAVKSLNIAQRFKAKLKEKVIVKELTSKQLQDILNDYTLKEMQQDIIQDKYIFDSVRSQSQNIKSHYSKFLENREFSFNVQKELSINQAQSNLFLRENQTINREREINKKEGKDDYIDIIEGYEKATRQQSAGPAEYQKLFANSFQNINNNFKIQDEFPANIKKQLSNTTQQLKQKLINKISRTQELNQEDVTFNNFQNQQNEILISNQKQEQNIIQANLNKFPIQVQKEYLNLNEFVKNSKYIDKNQKSKEQKLQEIIFNQKLEQFYNLLREYQIKLIDNGQQVSIEKIKEEFLRQIYESNSTDGGHLKDYKNIELQNSHVSLQYIDQSAATEQINQTQTQYNTKKNQQIGSNLRNKIIEGTVFTKNGIVEINNDQRELEIMMIELQNKFKNISEDFFSELDRDDLKIFQKELKDEDITDYKNVTIGKNGQQKQGMTHRDQLMYGNDKILKKLRENLNTENNLPFDLCNILKQDIEEKGKQRQIELQSKKNQQKRIENRKLMMIKHEFYKYKGQNRHVQILDLIIGNLKFFQRFNEEQRKQVYENAEYISFPARTIIFKQGDLGDKMYVILKGRVAVEKTSQETGNLPLVIAILEDGQHFGELSLIDQEKVVNNTRKSHILDPSAFDEQPKFQGRKASCITTEQTDLLILNQELSMKLYQPTAQKEASTNSEKFIIQDKESENTEMKNDELSRKIRILQKIPYFNDVDPKNLMPIAANIVPKTYSFGEFLVKRGEVPQGLFIIIKGQCKVVATRFGVRRLVSKQNQSNDIQNQKRNYKKLGVIDKTINQFNPETSILNQVKTNHRAYQNERVLIDENGKEIKDRIEYQDFMAFSQLTQGNVFGGRILIPFEHYQSIQRICFGMNAMDRYYPIGCNKEEIDNESEEFYHMKSLLSIVADSAKVDVWIIEKQDMNYLQDKDLKLIYEKIVRMKEEDRPYHEQDINFIIDQFQKWDKYKIDCIEALFDRKIMEKWFKGKT